MARGDVRRPEREETFGDRNVRINPSKDPRGVYVLGPLSTCQNSAKGMRRTDRRGHRDIVPKKISKDIVIVIWKSSK